MNFSGFAKSHAVAEQALAAAIAKLEGKAGRAMTPATLDYTLINTDLWPAFPSQGPMCYLCRRVTPYACEAGANGIEIHVSEAEIEANPEKLVQTLYHAMAHTVLLHCGKTEWKTAPKNGRNPHDTLVVNGQSYPVQEVAV